MQTDTNRDADKQTQSDVTFCNSWTNSDTELKRNNVSYLFIQQYLFTKHCL